MPSFLSSSFVAPGDDLFTAWLTQVPARPRVRGWRRGRRGAGLVFAFYGRNSTSRFQDPVSSRQWQRDSASQVADGHGRITCDFFDVGYSRRVPWHQRPQAAALLAAAARPDRDFDAVVIGEFERAFDGEQARPIIALLHAYGVTVWMPEFGGPVDLTNPAHQALLLMLGHQAEREVLRSRWRTSTAMCAQARSQGRHLGGRPPYGYRLVDAGPHPNRQHARWGRRLHRLDPNPETASHVRWIFAQRLAGASTAGIARALNQRGVPSPAAHDPGRNPHRPKTVWTVRTVAAILANPRYTGRQVWNRQRTDHHEAVPGDKRTSTGKTRAWNPKTDWIVSQHLAHPALVSETDFRAAQQISAAATPHDDQPRVYALTGLLICQRCGRRLQPHWVHGHPGYRCRHGYTSAHQPDEHPRWIYWPERRIQTEILAQLAGTGQAAADASIRDVAAYLQDRDAAIICSAATVTVDEPSEAAEPATTAPPLTTVTPVAPPPTNEPAPSPPRSGRSTPGTLTRPTNGVIARWIQRTPPPPSRKRE
jgi:site-specific DNA recombinase